MTAHSEAPVRTPHAHVSHSVPALTLRTQPALSRNGPGSEHPLQVASAAVSDFLNLTVLEKAGGGSRAKGVGSLRLGKGDSMGLPFRVRI